MRVHPLDPGVGSQAPTLRPAAGPTLPPSASGSLVPPGGQVTPSTRPSGWPSVTVALSSEVRAFVGAAVRDLHQAGVLDDAALSHAITRLAELAAGMAPTREHVEEGARLLKEHVASGHERRYEPLLQLTRNDRTVLGLLYVAERLRDGGRSQVDQLASALVSRRQREQLQELVQRRSLPPTGPHDWVERATVAEARSFASPEQLAARVASVYRSVAPPAPESLRPPARPLDVAHALGLGALVAAVHTRSLRRRRRRRRRHDARRARAQRGALGLQAPWAGGITDG